MRQSRKGMDQRLPQSERLIEGQTNMSTERKYNDITMPVTVHGFRPARARVGARREAADVYGSAIRPKWEEFMSC